MTVQIQNPTQYYAGPISIGTELSVTDFTFAENSHVSVKVRGASANWVYGSDYSVSGAGTLDRRVTVLKKVEADEILAVFLDVPITQGVSPEEGGNLPAATLEYTFDKLTYICQDLNQRLRRALQVSVDSNFDGIIYDAPSNTGKAFIVNELGTGISYSSYSVSDLEYIAKRLYASIDNVDIVADNMSSVLTDAQNISAINTSAQYIANINTTAANIGSVNTVAIDLNLGTNSEIKKVNANKANIDTVASNIIDVSTVASDIANVSAVADDLTNIDAVKNNATNINTVASNIGNINTVAEDIININAVAANKTNIDAVKNNATNINTVAGNKSNIDTVATNIADVVVTSNNISVVGTIATDLNKGVNSEIAKVNANKTNIDLVGTNIVNVSAAGGNITNINMVAANEDIINSVANDIININAVAANKTNIDAVKNNATNINTVAGISTDVIGVATISTAVTSVNSNTTNINTVASNIGNINTVAEDIININAVAADLTNIDNASVYAEQAQTSAAHSQIYAEGTDEQVQALGGIHSAKNWSLLQGLVFMGEYSSSTTYSKNHFVSEVSSTSTSFYLSRVGNNTGHALTESNYWLFMWTSTSGGTIPFPNITGNPMDNPNLAAILNGKQDKSQVVNTLATSGTISLTDNSINEITPSGNVAFSLPSGSTGNFHQILVQINMSTARTINVGTTYFFNNEAPDLSTTGTYNLIYEYDSSASHWVCGVISKGAAS